MFSSREAVARKCCFWVLRYSTAVTLLRGSVRGFWGFRTTNCWLPNQNFELMTLQGKTMTDITLGWVKRFWNAEQAARLGIASLVSNLTKQWVKGRELKMIEKPWWATVSKSKNTAEKYNNKVSDGANILLMSSKIQIGALCVTF